jgi:mannose-6-phosphate isomerase-like protein (cupin superfamily)
MLNQNELIAPPLEANTPTAPTGLWAVHRDNVPIEGGFDAKYGDAMWQTLICADRMQSNGLVLGTAHLCAFGKLPLHRHLPAEFYFATAGTAEVMIDGTAIQANPGMAIFIPGNAEHGITAGPDGFEFLYGFAQDRFGDVTYNFSQQQEAEQ